MCKHFTIEIMFQKKNHTWGASLRIYKGSNSYNRHVVMEEDFHPLMK